MCFNGFLHELLGFVKKSFLLIAFLGFKGQVDPWPLILNEDRQCFVEDAEKRIVERRPDMTKVGLRRGP